MLRRQPQPSYYQQRPLDLNQPRNLLREPQRRPGPQPIRFNLAASRSIPDYNDSQRNSEPLDSQEYYENSQQRPYEPRYNNDPLRDSGSGLEPDLAEQKKMISDQTKMLDEIMATINASKVQLNSLADNVKSNSQNLEASQEKVIQPVFTLLQTLAEDVKRYYSDSRPVVSAPPKPKKNKSADEWKSVVAALEKTVTKVMNNFEKQQDKKMKDVTKEIINQVREMLDKKTTNQLEVIEQSALSCLSNKVAPLPAITNEILTAALLSPEHTQILEAAHSAEPVNATQPTSNSAEHVNATQLTSNSAENSNATTTAPEKRRRKTKTHIRDLPIMGNDIEQSQALSQLFDCDDNKGRYNLRRRVQVPVMFDENNADGTSALIKKENQPSVPETQEFAWWDADDTAQEQRVKPAAKKRGRKRKADLISPSPVPFPTTIHIENLCNTSSSLGPVPLEDCPDEVDGDFNWVRVFHKVQKLV